MLIALILFNLRKKKKSHFNVTEVLITFLISRFEDKIYRYFHILHISGHYGML